MSDTTLFQPVDNSYSLEGLTKNFGEYHFFTVPIGLIGLLSIIRYYTKSSSSLLTLTAFYLLSLIPVVSLGVFVGTALLSALIVYAASALELNLIISMVLAAVGCAFQLVGSFLNEGSQIAIDLWVRRLSEQVYYSLPSVVNFFLPVLKFPEELQLFLNGPAPSQMQQVYACAWILSPLLIFVFGSYCLDSKNRFCFFPGAPYFYRVLQCSLLSSEKDCESRQSALKTVRDWVMGHSPSEDTSSHYWYRDLQGDVKAAFDACATAPQITRMFRCLFSERNYCVDVVSGMNEIYVTGPPRSDEGPNSDQIFYTRHVDGPWGFIPFVSVYRCIVGMDKNLLITTHFPLAGVAKPACEGDVLAFDFNREVHYITSDESKRVESDSFRVTLKLHYCVYPRVLAPLGWLMHFLNVRYNQLFRALFLKTIRPESLYEHFLAWNVTANTDFYDKIETYFGMRNILYVAFAASLWWATGSYATFFALTSYVHYFRYISTYYIRRGIDFGSFKRDVLLFKSLALAQLIFHYLFPRNRAHPFALDLVSIAMILSGYAVSMLATRALGINRTYFAAELGLVEPKWITVFPYGYIPHPMIVSQIWALLGFFKAVHFRAEWPLVVPVHISLYVTHMLQEHFDIYRRYPTAVVVESADRKSQ